MTTVSSTYVLYPPLGSAVWRCDTENKKAWGDFSATGIEKSSSSPITLKFKHIFFSKKKTSSENDALIAKLATILTSVGAKEIKATIDDLYNCQQINANYYIENIKSKDVDTLTSAIAEEAKKVIIELSK
jgi:RNAse (barnase) inhibitor barstar